MPTKFVYIILLFMLLSGKVNGTTFSSSESGDWMLATNWTGNNNPPTTISNNDTIIINQHHSLTLNANLIVNNKCVILVYGSLKITGNITANNQFTLSIFGQMAIQGSLIANNNYTTSISGDLVVSENIVLNNNADLEVDGSLMVYGDFDGGNNNTLTGSGEVHISGSMSGLIVTGGFTGTLNQNFNFKPGLVNYGCAIKVGTGSAIYVDGDALGNFSSTYNNGKNGVIISDGAITLEGDWNNYSADYAFKTQNATGVVVFKGTNQQNIGGSKTTQFENLWVENSNGISINDNTIISNQLNFITGNISTTSTDTLIVTNTNTYAIANQGPSKGVVGNLRRYLAEGQYSFPLCYNTDYLPAVIEITDISSMQYVSAKFTDSNTEVVPASLNVMGTPIYEFLDRGYWTFTPDNGAGVEYDITLTSSGHTNGSSDPTQFAVFKRDGGDWESVGTHSNSTQIVDGAFITAKRSNLTDFSDFIIGRSESSPLPIVWGKYEAICQNKTTELYWQTISELNNERFDIEYSENGIDFITIGTVMGSGNTNTETNYWFSHAVSNSTNYYRITQYDFDGKNASTPIIVSNCKLESDDIFSIEYVTDNTIYFRNTNHKPFNVILYDALGRVMRIEKFEAPSHDNHYQFTYPSVNPGCYLLKISDDFTQFTTKLILK